MQIQISENREEFAKLLEQWDIPQPENGIARSLEEARQVAKRIGYPVLVPHPWCSGDAQWLS